MFSSASARAQPAPCEADGHVYAEAEVAAQLLWGREAYGGVGPPSRSFEPRVLLEPVIGFEEDLCTSAGSAFGIRLGLAAELGMRLGLGSELGMDRDILLGAEAQLVLFGSSRWQLAPRLAVLKIVDHGTATYAERLDPWFAELGFHVRHGTLLLGIDGAYFRGDSYSTFDGYSIIVGVGVVVLPN